MHKYSIEDLRTISEEFAQNVVAPFSILLSGEMGVGKTTFSKFFIERLLVKKQNVTSPTFNIIHVYETIKGPIWHIDLYRVEEGEFFGLGIIEAMQKYICLVEWPKFLMEYVNDSHCIELKL
ncbi:MAG: tRNA (adenosine(37)-N6)-threonylcarbamoyltransferase complex ATPase subunit type 1 TsaE [Holosporales bacterium]|jgi:tRNA threonylcarbamoyladenosine biosynthesis protein TsaE|nr:tRNA (adenosine(37)-N6)-threonylcarbamoyltransferase complex ATPase subunit type 1 TsaE [Holosporales bacterium]